MASRNETLLFLIDVQVRGSNAIRELDAEFAAVGDRHVRRLQALQEATSDVTSSAGGSGKPVVVEHRNAPGNDQTQIVGIRGRQNPGSRMNPIITAQESGAASGLGSLAQPTIPTPSASDSGDSAPNVAAAVPVPSAPQISPQQGEFLSQAAQDVAAKVITPEDNRVLAAVQSTARTNRNIGINPVRDVADAAADAARGVEPSSGPSRSDLATQLAQVLAARQAQMPKLLNSGDAASRLGSSRTQVRELAATGGIPGAYKEQGQWVIPEESIDQILTERAAAGGAGAGGGGRPPYITSGGGRSGGGGGWYAGGGGGRGGHGSRFQWNPLSGSRSNSDLDTEGAFSLANIFKGDGGRGGAFGLPGFGSVGSLAGLGLEHWMLTGAGLAVSAGSAIGGAGLLGTAGLTKDLVGGGADALVNEATLSQVKALSIDYGALQTAVTKYGAQSKQAATAQGVLNQQMADAGGGQAGAAELQVAKNVTALQASFDKTSNGARAMSASIMNQGVQLAQDYVPLITSAAQRNLSIINTALKPLFSWLEGPQGMGIIQSLENSFASDLPMSIHALDMGIEDFLRLMQAASQYTGGLANDLNNFFTDKNKESAAQYDAEVQKLVGDLREWEGLLKVLGQDMGGIFKDDQGTANSIVGELTQMLEKLHDWEESSSGQGQLKTVFAVHKQQIDALLNLLPDLAKGYGNFYLDVAPPLVKALTSIAGALTKVLNVVENIPGGDELVGLSIILGKLGILGPGLRATATALGLMTDAEAKNAPVAAKDAIANGGLDTSLSAGGVAGKARVGETAATDLEGGAAAGGAFKAGSVLDKIATSGVGTSIKGGVETGALAAGGAAEGAGLAGLADAITGAGAAVAPLAAGLVPVLAAAGGVAGLIELFKVFSDNSSSYGTTIANNLAKTLNLSPADTAGVKHAANAAKAASQAAAAPMPGARGGAGLTRPSAADAAKAAADFRQEGLKAAANFVQGEQSVKAPSTLQVFTAIKQTLDDLSPQARDAGGAQMLAYAQGMQKNGDLPKGAFSAILGSIENQFPGLSSYLHEHGLTTASDLANVMKMPEVVANTQSLTKQLEDTFGDQMFHNVTQTSSNMVKDLSNDFLTLKEEASGQTGAMLKITTQNMGEVRQQVSTDLAAMAQNASIHMLALKGSITSGSSSAVNSATSDFQALASNIANAMASGALATGKGAQLIGEALNAELTALHVGKIPLVALQSLSAKQLLGEAHYITAGGTTGGAGGAPGLHAIGGLLQIGRPGAAGRDTVPLNVGGRQIVVGDGEQVAVLNRHQAPIVNRALAREGYAGLSGLFGAVQTPNYMAGGGFVPGYASGGQISVPGVSGSGAIATIATAALKEVTNAANKIIGQDTAAASGGSGGGIGTGGLSGSLIQIVHEIAKKMGWGAGLIQDWLNVIGVESGGSMTATNPQSGAYGIAQMNTGTGVAAAKAKYYQYGGNPNTMVGQLVAMANYMQDSYGGPAGAWESEETRHSYALGGLLPAYATGGQPDATGSTLSAAQQRFLADAKRATHKTASKPKKPAGLKGAMFVNPADSIGANGPFPFNATDYQAINAQLQAILNIDGTDAGSGSQGGAAGALANQIAWWTNVWESSLYASPNFSSWDSPSDFILSSTDSAGNTTYSISPNINEVASQLAQITGWQGGIVGDLQAALGGTTAAQPTINKAIQRRVAEIAKIKKRIESNIAQIKAIKKRIADAQALLKAEKAKKAPYAKPKNKTQRAANTAFELQRQATIQSLTGSIAQWQKQLDPYESENTYLGGKPDSLQSDATLLQGTSGTGELGALYAQLGSPATGTSAIATALATGSTGTGLYGLLSTVQGWGTGLNGTGGDIPTQLLQLQEYQAGLAGLLPGANSDLAAQIASAATSAATSASTASITGETGFSFQGQEYVATMAGMPGMALGGLLESATGAVQALQGLPKWGGSFMLGGTVPGAPGEPRLIQAHGGEIITNPNLPGGSSGGSLATAMRELSSEVRQHHGGMQQLRATMGQLTHETARNTASMSNTRAGSVRYGGQDALGAYSENTSSDSWTNMRVGL